jgi:7,8-dihydro-6-hydroxymethylpterin dimethyltransferase
MFHEETEGLCPECLRRVKAEIQEIDGRIWLISVCPRHGESRAVLASDAAEYRRFRTYAVDRSAGAGCCGPDTDCADGPPTCVLLLEITQACNLTCPTCYADAVHGGTEHMSLLEAKTRLDTFFQTQSRLDVLMLSGGEPTIHPQLSEFLDLTLSYPIDRVLINTNGVRIAKNTKLAELLKKHSERVELYLSFASLRPERQEHFYNKNLIAQKIEAIEVAKQAGVFVTLVPTVERGINDDEVGDLYNFALSHSNINGITYQPVMDNGRYIHGYDPAERLTLTGVLERLEKQTQGALILKDFVGLPCSHPDCCVLTYGILDEKRTKLTPLPRHLDVARYLELFSDKISFTGLIEAALKRVWSDTVSLRGGQTLKDLAMLYAKGGVKDLIPIRNNPKAIGSRVFRVVVKPFMDATTYDCKRVDQCCTKLLDETGTAVSFCEYNVFRRGRVVSSSLKTEESKKFMPLMIAK